MRDIVLAYIVGLASAFVIAFGLFAGIVYNAEDAPKEGKHG